jgi:hypothetical protein
MSERLRAMSDEELGVVLSALPLAWPATPDLALTVMASTRAARRPRVVRLPLSRAKRFMLVAAATLVLLAGVALATRFVIDLGAVVVEVTPAPGTQQPTSPATSFGEPITLEEAETLLGGELRLPTHLGRPDQIWADEVFTDVGEVVRITATWGPAPDLPVIEGTEHGAVLMRFEGDTDQASKEVYEDTGVVEPARVDGIDGVWTTGAHVLRLLTSDGIVLVRVDGNVLLWRDGRYTMRLETALPKADVIRIAASTGTSRGSSV